MITYFNGGQNRVWHRATNFKSGACVQIKLWKPDFTEIPLIKLTEFRNEGLYSFDYDFNQRGTWLAIVYEDGKKVTSNTFQVDTIQPGIVVYKK